MFMGSLIMFYYGQIKQREKAFQGNMPHMVSSGISKRVRQNL